MLEIKDWSFHTEGMKCIKCIRKVQAVSHEIPSIEHLKIDLGLKKIILRAKSDFDPELFITKVKALGYELKVLSEQDLKDLKAKSSRSLLEIGVAGFCTGNIMLFSAAEYVGADVEAWFKIFPILSGLLFLPVLIFSSVPFFANSYYALRAKKMSIDTPIMLAIFGGSLISYYNLALGRNEVYFDSISMFIFLLLSSRYLIFKIQSRYLSPIKVEDVFSDHWVQKVNDGRTDRVTITSVNVGDVIEVLGNKFVPLDGELLSPEALIDDSFFSGEFLPKTKSEQDLVFAGSKNLASPIRIRVKKVVHETRLAEIVDKINHSIGQKTYITSLADRGANYLVVAVFILSAIVLSYFSFFDFHEGINRVLALLVVACPCGLAIVIPLIQTLALKKGLQESILIKQPAILENLSLVDTIFFDKTGTLTSGEIRVSGTQPSELSDSVKAVIYNLEIRSEHPIAKSIRKWTEVQDEIELFEFKETLGSGVSAFYLNNFYELKSSMDDRQSSVSLFENSRLVATLNLEDTLADGAEDLIEFLTKVKVESYVLSGDLKSHALKIAHALKIKSENVMAGLSPEDKYDFVKDFNRPAIYIGDGVNDSLAMSECLVSVSMESSANVAFKTSSVHILSKGLSGLKSLFELSACYLYAIKVTILISFVYNFVFAIFALLGLIGPLIAVILMPLSSISLTLLAIYLMRDRDKGFERSRSARDQITELQGAIA